MGKSWKNTMISANSAKKGAITTKLAREIQVASKMGGPDPETNSRLRSAIDAAKEASVPKDTIERAIKRGAGLLEGAAQIEEVVYEGYGPHQVGILVECQTDNRHRTAPDIRNTFNKNGGSMGESGSVAWMFERVCLLEGKPSKPIADPEEEAIEAGANEVEKWEDTYSFWGAPEDLKTIEQGLIKRGWKLSTVELSYKPKNMTDLSDAQKAEVLELVQALDDNDDSHRIYTTADL